MARLCGARYETYKTWESRGKWSHQTLYAIKEALKIACPELPVFDLLRIEEADFPIWLEENLKARKERGISGSDQALRDLIEDWEVWKALGGNVRLHHTLREKLPIYREDLDKEDWIAVIRLMQAGKLAEQEWEFTEPDVMARRVRFKMPQGGVLTDDKWEKIQRIVREEIAKMQGEEKHKREQE